ncbi:hypothetical protein FACS189454_04640 [Planctomycetales bacterium]|nr:hypothetical protein FACS189454_04640 [Planctomycetales bacterium]
MKPLVVILLVVVCVLGCNRDSDKISHKVKTYSSSQGASEQVFGETNNTKTLTHDFGVIVQPIEKEVTCEFEIKNETDNVWNLKQIVNTCSCTIADMTSPKVEAGKTEKILVVYKPVGEGSFDDTRKSLITFEEKETPLFVLYVKSRVREPMTLKPKSLSWAKVGENQAKRDSFEIQNYSGEDWETIEVVEKPEWLKFECKKVPPPQTEPMMKQLWLAEVRVDAAGMKPGGYRGEIRLAGGNGVVSRLPVTLQIASAVSAIPTQLFFGNVRRGEVVTKSIKIIFNPDSIPKNKDEIHFEHGFGRSLQFEWLSSEGETWELQASLKLDNVKIPDEPLVVMTFADPKLPKMSLPIYLMPGEDAKVMP